MKPSAVTPVRVSVIILTRDEAANIGACLESLEWADEVILVDSGSTDGTSEIVRQVRADARLFSNPFEDFSQQRNWALENTSPRHEWILFLDADERGNPAFQDAVAAAIGSPADRVGFFLCYRNYFLGRWIRRSTLFPSWQLRLLRIGQVRFQKEGHGQREVTGGPLGYIHAPYDHYGFSKGVAHWITRHNSYSTQEVELILRLRQEPFHPRELVSREPVVRRRALKRLAARVGWRPFLRFGYLYLCRGGFLDGRAGFLFCLLRVAHEIHITVKLAEVERWRPASHPGVAAKERPPASRHPKCVTEP